MSIGKTAVISIISILFFSMVLGSVFAQPKGVQPIYPAPEQWKAVKAKKNYVIGGCVPMLAPLLEKPVLRGLQRD